MEYDVGGEIVLISITKLDNKVLSLTAAEANQSVSFRFSARAS